MNRLAEIVHYPSTDVDFDKRAFDKRLAAVKQARNPLLEAARVLLRAQANMPGRPDNLPFQEAIKLRDTLEQEVRIFEQLCGQAHLRQDHTIGARYCLCTALDEAAMQSEWGKDVRVSAAWAEKSLATTFLEDNKGGERIYLLIGRLLENASDHIDLLQVIYRILSLGFKGRYRHDPAGDRKHLLVRTRLYNEIVAHRGLVPLRLSSGWQPEAKNQRLWFYDVPLWLTVVVLSAILLGMFGWYKYQLLNRTAVIREQIGSIARLTPPLQLTQPSLPSTALLKDTMAAGKNTTHSTVIFRGSTRRN